jgi:hypothetical protein
MEGRLHVTEKDRVLSKYLTDCSDNEVHEMIVANFLNGKHLNLLWWYNL